MIGMGWAFEKDVIRQMCKNSTSLKDDKKNTHMNLQIVNEMIKSKISSHNSEIAHKYKRNS